MAEERAGPRLVFVYNANSGLASAALDTLHKLVLPGTYACALCAVTYGAVSMRREWKEYVDRLPYPVEFLHRDEFCRRWPGCQVPLPAILLDNGGAEPDSLVGAEQMRVDQSVAELIGLLNRALADHASQRV